MSCPFTSMSAWWWLIVIETCSKFYIIEYIVVFWLNDFLIITTQRDGSYQKSLASQVWKPLYLNARHYTLRNPLHARGLHRRFVDNNGEVCIRLLLNISRFLVSNGNAVQKSVLINQGADAEVQLLSQKKCQKSQACLILDAPKGRQ